MFGSDEGHIRIHNNSYSNYAPTIEGYTQSAGSSGLGMISRNPETGTEAAFDLSARNQLGSAGVGSDQMAFRLSNYITAILVAKGNGNVGIGFSNPQYKLSVDGIISATEIKVSTTPNSDYVFEPDYELKSLHEVDQFIQQNKHL